MRRQISNSRRSNRSSAPITAPAITPALLTAGMKRIKVKCTQQYIVFGILQKHLGLVSTGILCVTVQTYTPKQMSTYSHTQALSYYHTPSCPTQTPCTYGCMLSECICTAACRRHCWPHTGSFLCSSESGYWSTALQSESLQTEKLIRYW